MPDDSTATPPRARWLPADHSVDLGQETPSPASSTCSLRAQAARDEETRPIWMPSPLCITADTSNDRGDYYDVPAETWFEQSNKNVGSRLGPQFLDNDPPFFQQNQALDYPICGTYTENLGNVSRASNHNVSQFMSGFGQNTNESSIEDFRSLIDDLTIQNKKLRERLRKYERSSGIHLEKDRLFEIKFHGLNPGKKRELEETLRAFASSVNKDEVTDTSTSRFLLKEDKHAENLLRQSSKNPSSVSTSSRVVDSGYASLSTSSPKSASTANRISLDKTGGPLPPASSMGKIQSFLDDMPHGLLPKYPTVMTEREKKKQVVRRLEELFTGKLRVPRGANSQPQQQEVSNYAARDDRLATERRGQRVSVAGIREAHILDMNMEMGRAKLFKPAGEPGIASSTPSQAESGERNMDAPSSPDQRPTRPLDLDPDRAQIPSENIEYIRHLGISTPFMAAEDRTDSMVDDDHGWVYLNLLINMAQLHIINVTPDFIRSAVKEFSAKFQLSSDGRKIKWRGGDEGTELSSDSGADNGLRPSPNDGNSLNGSSQKNWKFDSVAQPGFANGRNMTQGRFSSIPIVNLGSSKPTRAMEQRRDVHYKPLFAHRSDSEDDMMSHDFDDFDSQVSYAPLSSAGTGLQPNVTRTTVKQSHSGSSSKRKRDEGAVVFYSGAPFCTDLSGDREDISTPLHVSAVAIDGFSNHSHDALGCKPEEHLRLALPRTSYGLLFPFRSFKGYPVCTVPMSDDDTSSHLAELIETDEDLHLNFSPRWSSTEKQHGLGPVRLEACGLGGTRPADHFVYVVETRRRKLTRSARLKLSKYSLSRPRSQRISRLVSKSPFGTFQLSNQDENKLQSDSGNESTLATSESMSLPVIPLQSEILSMHYQALEPSDLPPPATFHGPFSNSTEWSDDSSSDGDEEGIASGNGHRRFPVRTLSSTSLEDSMEVDRQNCDRKTSDMDESSTSSIDILAHARKIDPDSVAANERQYEQEISLQHNEKSPATADSVDGSSSAVSSSEGSDDLVSV